MSDDGERIDLETFLNVLDVEQLQSLIVQMIVKDPENFDLLESATHYVDHENLLQQVEEIIDVENVQELTDPLSKMSKRFEGYMSLQLYENALVVLYAWSNQIIMNLIELGIDKQCETTNTIVTQLENAWKALCQKYTPSPQTLAKLEAKAAEEKKAAEESKQKKKQSEQQQKVTKGQAKLMEQYQIAATELENDVERAKRLEREAAEEEEEVEYKPTVEAPYTLMKIFETLAGWRQQLAVLGPIFDDALRVLKLRVIEQKAKEQAEQEKQANTTTPAAASTATKTTTTKASAKPAAKRKMAPKAQAGDDTVKKVAKKAKQ